MEIKKLIKIFEGLLTVYKQKNKTGYEKFVTSQGLCTATYRTNRIFIFSLFEEKGYYQNFVINKHSNRFIAPPGQIKPRIRFLETEIKDLKRLLKKGYTHV